MNSEASQRLILDSSQLVVYEDDEKSILQVLYKEPDILKPLALIFGFAVLSYWLFSPSKTLELMNTVIIGLLVCGILFIASLMKSDIASTFVRENKVFKRRMHGFFSSGMHGSWPLVDIIGVGIKRHVSRYGDGFGVFLIVKPDTTMEITGSNLSFSNSQLCAETIRGFLGIKDPIRAVD